MTQTKSIALNRRATHDYTILESFESGIVLLGTEVKSIRQGLVNLKDSHIMIEDYELWLYNCHIAIYDHGNRFNHEPTQKRKLLMNKKQIIRLKSLVKEKGLNLIPLKFYFKGSLIKVEIGLGKGKKLYDKRESITQRDTKRDIERLIKNKEWKQD